MPPAARTALERSARHAYVNATGVTLLLTAAGITVTALGVALLLRPDRRGQPAWPLPVALPAWDAERSAG